MDPNQVTQVFQRCPSCRAVISPADASCPTCGRSLADQVDRTIQLPRLEADPQPITSPDLTVPLPTMAPRPSPAPPPGAGPHVVYSAPPARPRHGFPFGLLLAALLVGLATLVYLAVTRAVPLGVGLPSPPSVGAPPPQAPVAQTAPGGWVVANTGGEGVYLRRTPRLDDRLVAWPDGTSLQDLGEEATGDGLTWRKVRDPNGNVGYVPTKWLAPRA